MISSTSVDRILQTVRVEDVVSDFVKLRKRGVNLLGLCPFHNEKTPSFTVSPVKGIYKCFGCGKSGGAVNFIMDIESISYPDALRYLASKYNIEIEETEQTESEKRIKDDRESLHIVLSAAQKFFSNELENGNQGKTIAMPYFRERGLLNKTIQQFQLGWSINEKDAFANWAITNGYNKELILKAGLAIEKEDGTLLDRFRERVMFPIHNPSGKIAGFGGRILRSHTKEAKYINSPETEVYNKSRILYGYYQARKAIRQNDSCVLVEGYMDVLSMHQAGVEYVVASSGTSLTEEQLSLIKRQTDHVIFFFDGDEAGKKAAVRALEMALQLEMNPRVAVLPPEHDPDSFAKVNDKEAIEDFLKNESLDFLNFQLSLLPEDTFKDPVRKTEAVRNLLKSIVLIKDSLKTAFYIKELGKKVDLEEQLLYEELRRLQIGHIRKQNNTEDPQLPKKEAVRQEAKPQINWQERYIIKMLLQFWDKPFEEEENVGKHITERLEDIEWKDPYCEIIFNKYYHSLREGFPMPQWQEFLKEETGKELQEFVSNLLVEAHSLSPNWQKLLGRPVDAPGDNISVEINNCLLHLELRKIQYLIGLNREEMKTTQDEEGVSELLELDKHLSEMKKKIAAELGLILL